MTADSQRQRVFVVDDHEAVRDGLRTLIDASGDLRVVGEASSCAEALARIPATRPDVVILDLRLPDGEGLDTCREINRRLPEARILVLTATSEPEAQRRSREAGVAGHLVKSARRHEVLATLRRVATGEQVFDDLADPAPPTGPSASDHDAARVATLASDERAIVDLIVLGRTNHAIATQLRMSDKTVKKLISTIFVKLGVSTRVEAAVVATRAARSRHPSAPRADGHRIDLPGRTGDAARGASAVDVRIEA